ncbi:MAG TPA: CRTAC1 family protein [Blastocatellia bacterium]|nr:CRTAC1 family protein [Blastocatellia bacterium]
MALLALCLASMQCGGARTPPEVPVREVFTETADAAGLRFAHANGASGRWYMPEIVGSGGGFLDYDNDGWLDAYLVQCGPLPGAADQTPNPNRLFHNNGDGTFTDVTEASGAGDIGYGQGCAFGDVDNDGDVDIYCANVGPNRLYLNNGNGTFTDVTARAGVGDPGWSTSCAFADYDGDGYLDLYVVNYLEYSFDKNVLCGARNNPEYCGPDAYPGAPDVLYHNNGDGTFTDVTRKAGVSIDDPAQGKGLGIVWFDYDDDGDPDAFIANDSTASFLFRNNGDGTFRNVAVEAGCAFNERGMTEAGMGVDAGDVDRDGRLDIFVTHLNNETNTLYRNLGSGAFEDYTAASGAGPPSLPMVGFGTGLLDFDNDGDLDVFVTNGRISRDPTPRDPSSPYSQPAQLLENNGAGRFADVSSKSGAFFQTVWVGRGTAFGDIDNDGDVDVLVMNNNQRAVLLKNEVGSQKHWITLKVLDRRNRDAIGARVTVTAGDLVQVAEVRAGASYESQNDTRLHFGLGDHATVDRIQVRWRDGHVSDVPVELRTANRIVTIRE